MERPQSGFGWASFLGALLLFFVQPLIGKAVTPRFGGGVEVWMTCMLFFQATLLVGYAWANWVKGDPARVRIHLAGLGFAALLLLGQGLRTGHPLAPFSGGSDAHSNPFHVLGVLTRSVGLPLALLSATSPLLQSWFARTHPGDSPYGLYARSNAGSLVGLLAFPLLAEPYLQLKHLEGMVVVGFLAYLGLLMYLHRGLPTPAPLEEGPREATGPGPTGAQVAFWVGTSAAGTMVLMGGTNVLTLRLGALPLLWVVPLALYLLSFILIFEGPASRRIGLGWQACWALICVLGLGLVVKTQTAPTALAGVIGVALTVFSGSMLAHGALFAARPAAAHLTRYYLALSVGGVLGGFLVAVVAPLLYDRLYEFGQAIFLLAAMGLLDLRRRSPGWRLSLGAGGALGLLLLSGAGLLISEARFNSKFYRDFHGCLSVAVDRGVAYMAHGRTSHGAMSLKDLDAPLTYYYPESGIGRVVRAQMGVKPALRVGVVGLGVGSLASYGRSGDAYVFYELSPLVDRLAGKRGIMFPVLDRSKATCEVRVGDGRHLLEQERASGQLGRYDVLMIDAFSGDAVPWHLLTVEALQLYLDHLAPEGILVIHLSNPLPLDRVVITAAREMDLYGALLYQEPTLPKEASKFLRMGNVAVILARNPTPLRLQGVLDAAILGFGPKTFRGATVESAKLTFLRSGRAWHDERCGLSELLIQGTGRDELLAKDPTLWSKVRD